MRHLLVILLITLTLSACKGSSTSDNGTPSAPPAPVTSK